jgi:hypothetical protein
LTKGSTLDVYEISKEDRYYSTALDALNYYVNFYTPTATGGYFWYSDQNHDAFDVYNVNALLSAQYARAASLFDRKDFAHIAEKTFNHLWSTKEDDEWGIWWNYGKNQKKPNDLVHAVMIVSNVIEYGRYAKIPIETNKMMQYLERFLDEEKIREFVPHSGLARSLTKRPARVWGIGALSELLANHGSAFAQVHVLHALKAYEFAPGKYGMLPKTKKESPILQAYVALGLVGCIPCSCRPCHYLSFFN